MGPAAVPFLNSKKTDITPEKLVASQQFMCEKLAELKAEIEEKVPKEVLESWSAPLLVQLVQGLSATFVDDKFKISGEELAVAGFQQAMVLGYDKNFIESTMEQQRLLHELAQLCCGQGAGECSVM